MGSYIKYPILLVILILLSYAISIILFYSDLTLGSVILIIYVNLPLGVLGLFVTVKAIAKIKAINTTKAQKITYITINIFCLLVAALAISIPIISFIYVDITGF